MTSQSRLSTSAGQKVPPSPMVVDTLPVTETIVPELQELWAATRPFLKLSSAGPSLVGTAATDLFLNVASLLVSRSVYFSY